MKRIDKIVLILLTGILVLAAVLRLWNLGTTPPSLDWDEASWGYNSYSILQTGRDEYGKSMPVVIRSFSDYKPALYAYLDIPVIKVLGLNNFAVRFPDAFFGILTVLTTYFLVKEMFKRRDLALLSAFLLAVSPWSIQFARFTHEGIVGMELNLLMVLFFLKGLKNPIFFSLSAICAALALYSYQNEKLFVPLLGLLLLGIYWKQLLALPRKYLATAFVLGLLVSLPMVIYTFTTPASFTRAKGASFLNNPVGVLNERNYPQRMLIDEKNHDYLGLIFDNRRVVYVKDITGNYLSHFDPNFLFITGDKVGRHQPPDMAHLYLIELPFLLLGLYFLIFGKFDKKIKIFILGWILLVPIPAAFTWDVPNAGRTINFLPTFQILIALGVLGAYKFTLKWKKWIRITTYLIFGFLWLLNFVFYLDSYFVQYNYFNSQDFQYGYDQILDTVQRNYNDYGKIVVSNQIPLDQSYIFFLYHLKYPPSLYQKVSVDGTYKMRHKFDKYTFRVIDNTEKNPNTLYISGADVYLDSPDKKVIQRINFLNGKPAYVIYTGR